MERRFTVSLIFVDVNAAAKRAPKNFGLAFAVSPIPSLYAKTPMYIARPRAPKLREYETRWRRKRFRFFVSLPFRNTMLPVLRVKNVRGDVSDVCRYILDIRQFYVEHSYTFRFRSWKTEQYL